MVVVVVAVVVAVAVGVAVVVVVGVAVVVAVVVVVVVVVGVAVVVVVVVGVVNRAFARAEQARRRYKVPTPAQRRALKWLAFLAGVEPPVVRWRHEASDALRRLDRAVREPTLGPM